MSDNKKRVSYYWLNRSLIIYLHFYVAGKPSKFHRMELMLSKFIFKAFNMNFAHQPENLWV